MFFISLLFSSFFFNLFSLSDVNWLLPLPADLIALNTSKGISLISLSSTYKTSFYYSFQHLTTQQTQTFCSIATSVTILNYILNDNPPIDSIYQPYGYFTQDNFFNECTEKILSRLIISEIGSTLDQLSQMLSCYNVNILVKHANETNLNEFRNILKDTMNKGDQIASNFYRTSLGEVGGGHFSPLMAYEEVNDLVLLADVARFKYPPVWIPLAQFFDSMLTIDSASQLYRGFIVISKRQGN